MARVTLEGVRKVYDNGFVAVHGVDLVVEDGEFVVLVGPSGSGKSTTLRIIAGLESLSDGQLSIGGRVVNDVPPNERDIAMVFQSYALYPHMSVYENMAFALHLRKLPGKEIEARVREAANILGITAVLERRPKQLSGGQRQRVAIGRAIVRQPRVFLFDEPLSNLDAKLRVQMRREIARIRRDLKATVVYVTHDQVEAMTLGDRIVVMNEGRVEQIGSPLELYDHPRTLFVATFIGSPAMNLIEGSASFDGGARFVATDDRAFSVPLTAAQAERLAAVAPERLVAGIRPEDFHVADSATGGSTLSAIVDASEPLGNEVLLYLRAGGQDITVRSGPHVLPRSGDRLPLHVDPTRVHYFDRVSGRSI
ncbi:MAG TPA: sn-glycerol-3-phosphate ABC transporter ATP-binding protein UgpC [Gemmatimonadaceae bacterium]|nr:sn-glycerol-3-phosphate ABC transporter ATP-binding protein UgpC [Gemmatimonadaceae bacterium]